MSGTLDNYRKIREEHGAVFAKAWLAAQEGVVDQGDNLLVTTVDGTSVLIKKTDEPYQWPSIEELLDGFSLPRESVEDAAVYGARVALTTVVNRLLGNKGWTRARLAQEMGVSGGRVSQVLNTETDVHLSTVVRMLHVLGLDFSDALHLK